MRDFFNYVNVYNIDKINFRNRFRPCYFRMEIMGLSDPKLLT